jgi:hypothetical protein
MSGTAGQLRSISAGNRKWRFPADIDVTFWDGGRHNSEFQDDNAGGTFISKNTTGKVTGIVFRASKQNELGDLFSLIKSTVENSTPMTFEFANGDKWSAPVKFVIDEGGPLTSAEMKVTCDAYADNDTGEFVQL